MTTDHFAVRTLGPVCVTRNGATVELDDRQRAALATLAINGHTDDIGGLPDALGAALESSEHGYRLRPEVDLDIEQFRALADEGRRAAAAGDHSGASGAFTQALDLWKGPPLADVDTPGVSAARARLVDLHLTVVEAALASDLELGRHDHVVRVAESLTREHPERDGLWACLVSALDLSGHHDEARKTYRRARTALGTRGGGPQLAALEEAMLAIDSESLAQSSGAAELVYLDERGEQRTVSLGTDRVTIGRTEDADVSIAWDASVSRQHAEVIKDDLAWHIVDEGSLNGTYVEGERVRGRQRLVDGDRVRVGGTMLLLRLPGHRKVRTAPAGPTVGRTEDQQGEWATDLPSCRVTFLFTDVVGSTAAWEAHPETMGPAMRRHDVLIEGAVLAHAGTVVKPRGEGDSRFAVFRDPSDAARCALAVVTALEKEPWATPEPIRVRVALHLGSAELRGGDYYGPDVNRCARLRSAAEPNQVLVSAAAAEAIALAAAPGVRLRDLGLRELKDLPRPEHVFELLTQERSRDTAPRGSS